MPRPTIFLLTAAFTGLCGLAACTTEQAPTPDVKPDATPETKPDTTPDTKTETKPEPKMTSTEPTPLPKVRDDIPPIDAAAPKTVQTATFALG